jgi:hypothetical protein
MAFRCQNQLLTAPGVIGYPVQLQLLRLEKDDDHFLGLLAFLSKAARGNLEDLYFCGFLVGSASSAFLVLLPAASAAPARWGPGRTERRRLSGPACGFVKG